MISVSANLETVSKSMEKTIMVAVKSYGNDNNSCLAYFKQRRPNRRSLENGTENA
jgi:hypothetical protein